MWANFYRGVRCSLVSLRKTLLHVILSANVHVTQAGTAAAAAAAAARGDVSMNVALQECMRLQPYQYVSGEPAAATSNLYNVQWLMIRKVLENCCCNGMAIVGLKYFCWSQPRHLQVKCTCAVTYNPVGDLADDAPNLMAACIMSSLQM